MVFGTFIKSRLISATQKEPARVHRAAFLSEGEQWKTLCGRCRNGEIYGGVIGEMLRFGGKRNLMWIDIDTRQLDEVARWAQATFPKGSYRLIPSTTGKAHIYVSTDRPLKLEHELSMTRFLRESMPESIAPHLDYVRGPYGRSHAYFPFASRGDGTAVMPQQLMREASSVFVIPDIPGTEYEEFCKRRILEFVRQVETSR